MNNLSVGLLLIVVVPLAVLSLLALYYHFWPLKKEPQEKNYVYTFEDWY